MVFLLFVLGVKSLYLGVGIGVGILVPIILLVTAVIIVYKVKNRLHPGGLFIKVQVHRDIQ